DRGPSVVLRIHHDRRGIATLGIDHRPLIDVLPDRLETVRILLSRYTFAAAEDALLEFAESFERIHRRFHLVARGIAAAAGAAALQHDRERFMVLGLRPVMNALREVADHAGAERAVAAEAQLAFEHETDLLEIMPMARRVEIGGGAADRELEIIDAALLAFREVAEVERPAAIFETPAPFERITVYD